MSKKLFAVALILSFAAAAVAVEVTPAVAAQVEALRAGWSAPVEGGAVGWFSAPKETPNGWYYMYDNLESGPPFSDYTLPSMPSFSAINGTGSKLAPYNNEPFKYTLTDSFWFYGSWYEPGDYLFMSPDGWLSFDNASEDGFPTPPSTNPPIPNTDAPNSMIIALWADFNPTRDPGDAVTNNRVYYQRDPNTNNLVVEWYQIEGNATGNVYTFETILVVGGQDLLDVEGSCGVIFSRHYIHFLYSSSSAGWTADQNPAVVGIEDYTGAKGIWYQGTVANSRVIRAGYHKIFQNDVEPYAFLSPGSMALRWTDIEPQFIVRNVGTETEHFPVTLEIYDSGGDEVYSYNINVYDLLPGASKTVVAPCWEPGEINEIYDKVLYVSLDRDKCLANDTLVVQTFIHCDDTFRYDWNTGDWYVAWGISSVISFLTFYGVDGGVLVSGGRTMIGPYPGSGYDNPALEVWAANGGCGAASVSGSPLVRVTSPTNQAGWNYAQFGGFGIWATAGTPGNIWAGVTSSGSYYAGYFPECGLFTWPAAHSCYLGGGPGFGGYKYYTSFYWGGYTGSYYTQPTELFVHLGFGSFPLSPKPQPPCYYDEPHDLTAFRMEEPNIDYVEDGDPITPEIAIANIGRQAEPDMGFIPISFIAINTATGDVQFHDSSLINAIGWLGDNTDNPDTLYVGLPIWTPEGICAEENPIVDYELVGLVRLGEVGPDESDHCPYNDTVRRNVQCLLSHDVGVIDVVLDPAPNEEPDRYNVGVGITTTATVENFGYNAENNFEVRMEVVDIDSGGVLLWHNLQNVSFLDWRGNDIDNPYTIEVTFPVFTTPNDHHMTIECRTELVGDGCPDDDEHVEHINSGIAEGPAGLPFSLEISSITSTPTVSFAVPYSVGVSLKVYDISGKLVTTLVDGSQTPGRHTMTWNTSGVAKGIYLVRMDAADYSATKKVVIW